MDAQAGDVSGDPVVRIRFDTGICRACPVRQACTWAKDAPRQLTVRPQAYHEAMQAARQRQETAAVQRPVCPCEQALRAVSHKPHAVLICAGVAILG